MTAILALDTSTGACSACVWVEGEVHSEWRLQERDHTRLILPMVNRVLTRAGLSLAQIDAIGFTAGPGSFTGLRIGFGVVQGLAYGADLPVIPFSTLEVLACGAASKYQLQEGNIIMPALDARMDEIYWGLYQYSSGQLQALCPDRISKPEAVSISRTQSLSAGVGNGWRFAERMQTNAAVTDCFLEPDARDILEPAVSRYQNGKAIALHEAKLIYLRERITWKKREKLRRNSTESL